MILNPCCLRFITPICVVSSRGSPTPRNVSCSCFLNEKLSNQILLQCEELSSFSLWPLNFCYTTILFTATVSVRISSDDFHHAEAFRVDPNLMLLGFGFFLLLCQRGNAKYCGFWAQGIKKEKSEIIWVDCGMKFKGDRFFFLCKSEPRAGQQSEVRTPTTEGRG